MNFIFFIISFIILNIGYANQMIEGWFVDNDNSKMKNFPWEYYTHIHGYGPDIDNNGYAKCNKNNSKMITLIESAHKHDTKFIWSIGVDLNKILWNKNTTIENNYLSSIGKAINECNVDGLEADYEWNNVNNITKLGLVNYKQSTIFTSFLSKVKKSIHPNKTVSCDIGVEGFNGPTFPLDIFPWINVKMLNNGDIDYINLMSYHWSKNDIKPWERDVYIFHNIWGIDKNRINLGIGIYHIDTIFKKNNPIITPIIANKIGKFIKKEKLKGAFIFAATYDNYTNPLIKYIYSGIAKS